MIDRPLVRRTPVVDPSVDQWMLDRWSAPEHHKMIVMCRDRRHPDGRGGLVIDRDFIGVCSCGFRTIETERPLLDKCPVLDALEDRLRRLRKPTERIAWVPYVPPHVEPDPRD